MRDDDRWRTHYHHTAIRIAEKAIKNPYVHISHFIIMKMVIPGIFGVAESASEVKIIITLLFDLIMLFEVNYGIKFWKINTNNVFMIAKAIERAEIGKSIICINSLSFIYNMKLCIHSMLLKYIKSYK